MVPEGEESRIKLGVRQSIEELTGGRIHKRPREERAAGAGDGTAPSGGDVPRELQRIAEGRGDEADPEDVKAWKEGYRPGMTAEEARAKGIDSRTFISQEIEHHMEDYGMKQDQAVAAALSEARRGGYDVPREGERRE